MSKREAKPGLMAKALRRAFEDYYGKNGERLSSAGFKPVISDEPLVEEPLTDKAGDD